MTPTADSARLSERISRISVSMTMRVAGEAYSFISSRIVKEVIRLGGDIAALVPPSVEVRLRNRVLNGQ